MPDYVLKNKETGGSYVLSTPHGADDDYLAEALAPLAEAGWQLDAGTDAADVPPSISQPPTAVVAVEKPVKSEPKQAPTVQVEESTKEIS